MVDKKEDTRDVARDAFRMITMHMEDCAKFRETLQHNMLEFRQDIKQLNWRIGLMLGGIIVISKGIDFFLNFYKHQ
jgi:hypothetical protein